VVLEASSVDEATDGVAGQVPKSHLTHDALVPWGR